MQFLAIYGIAVAFGMTMADADGELHRFVKLFVNDEQIAREALDLPLGDEDRLGVRLLCLVVVVLEGHLLRLLPFVGRRGPE